jgi:DNA polymerase-3 subunit delta
MIIFLYGQDTYRSRQKLNEIIDHYKKVHKSGLNLKYLDCNDFTLEDIKNEIQTSSMFTEKKLIVIQSAFVNPQNEENFLELVKRIKNTDNIILIYEKKEIDNKSLLFKFLKKYGKSQEFKPLGGENLKNWLRGEFRKYQTEIDQLALDKLINFVGDDPWQLSNEVKKLVNFKSRKKISAGDIQLLVKPKIETDIFKTIDAIALKDRKRALALIYKHLEKGDNPLYLLSMINFQFKNLLIIKDLIERNKPYYSILKTSKLHPFVVKKTYELAKKFTLPELKKIYQRLFQADLSIKTGKISPETALDLLLAEI